jgi:hypothetical protein
VEKLHNEELIDLCSSRSIIRMIRWGEDDEMGGTCSMNREKRNTHRLLVVKLEGKRPLGRPKCSWVNNIRMDVVEVGWGDVDWIGLAQDRDRWRALVNSVLNLLVP